MNYFPFHVGDYVTATRHLSWTEDAAYRRLLDTYYTTETPLPRELRAVCRLVLAATDEQREAVRVVLEEFFVLAEDGWRNTRADAEIQTMQAKQQSQRDKAFKRWNKPEPEPGIALAVPRHAESDATAPKKDADAMPPTPTPTPTPTPKSKDKKTGASAPVSVSVLVDSGFRAEVAEEFIAHKARLRAPLTPRAWADHVAEAVKAGWSAQEAAEKVMAKGWKGFEAKYVLQEPRHGAQASPYGESRKDRQLLTAGLLTGAAMPRNPVSAQPLEIVTDANLIAS